MRLNWTADRRRFAPEGDGTAPPPAAPPPGAAGDTPPPGAAPPAAAPPAAGGDTPPPGSAKWWEGLSDQHRAYLTPKGLTVDDPLQALPKLIDIAANAEKRIGKGLDSIMDRPAKDQPYAEWARANAEVLGLPADATGYEVKPPSDWPKDLPWDAQSEAAVREIGLKNAVPIAAHQAYVNFQANLVRKLADDVDAGLAAAREQMMTELRRDFGDQLPARITGAQQAMQFVAEKAGLTPDGIEALSQTLSEKTGDAGVIRLFATLGELMADDTGFAIGRGQQSLGMTPAEARAALASFNSPEGAYGKAFAEGDQAKLAALQPERERLSKLAAQR